MRIVSLACSNTEIVCALGCEAMLVGVDDHSDHPPEVLESLPRVGPDLDIDVERVAHLRPDLVLATLTVPGHEQVVERLEAAGLPFIAPEPVSLDDVYRDVREIAERLGVPERGRELVERMRRELAGRAGVDHPTAPVVASPPADPPKVLVQWWPKPAIVPGRLSWTTELIEAAGGRNPIGDEPVKSRPVADEEVAELAPDAIVLSWCGVHPDKYRPEVVLTKELWADVPAVRNGQVHCVPEAFLGRPGPRLTEGYRALREIVEGLAPTGR